MSFNKKFFTTGGIVASSAAAAITGTDHFSPVTYTGNAGTQSISSLDFQPDFVWIKSRDNANFEHAIFDSVRGAGTSKVLSSNTTNAEGWTIAAPMTSFDSNGFTVEPRSDGNVNNLVNKSGEDLVAWCWKAAGAPTATNTAGAGNVPTAGSVKIDGADSTTALAGTIAAKSISANTASGFSIVSYTGTLSSAGNISVGHGLSSAPELIISKRTDSTGNWRIRPFFLNNNPYDYLEFDTGVLAQFNASDGTMSLPTSTTFDNSWNSALGGAGDVIAYCFHSVDGYQKVGSYTGTGATPQTINVGFAPRWVMIKNVDGSSESWRIYDTVRGDDTILKANTSDAESVQSSFEFETNGFTLTDNRSDTNQSGSTHIYLAIA
jgi:hypothetical protein